jgi:hypothetical protein
LPDAARQAWQDFEWQDLAAPGKRIDVPSLLLIAIICGVSSLASLWAALSGVDPSANLP